MKRLRGLYTAVITPFDSNGQIDEAGFRKNLRYQIEHQVDGILVLGTTGETPTLTQLEKRTIIKIAVEEVKGQTTLLVGTGSYSTQTTIKATQEAKDMGADGALVVVPYYNKPTQEGMIGHFSAICNAVSFPICIYNIPGRTGVNMHPETIQKLMQLPSIIGIKESSENISQFSEMISIARKHSSAFSVIAGDDIMTLPVIALGGEGIISVVSNLIPGPIKMLVQAALSGDFTTAAEIHHQLASLFKAAFLETNPIPIKAAMQYFGMPAGACRLPLSELTPQNLDKLKKVLDTYGKTQFSYR